MRLLVVSDTHGLTSKVRDIFFKLDKERPLDAIIHCGDYYNDAVELERMLPVPVIKVKGNCDDVGASGGLGYVAGSGYDSASRLGARSGLDGSGFGGSGFSSDSDLGCGTGISDGSTSRFGGCSGLDGSGFGGSEHAFFDTELGKVFVTHGHLEDVGYSMERLYYTALENDCIIACFGHTHRALFTEVNGVYIMNPGSLSKPRDGSTGTFGIIDTDSGFVSGRIYVYDDFVAKYNAAKAAGAVAQSSNATGNGSKAIGNDSDATIGNASPSYVNTAAAVGAVDNGSDAVNAVRAVDNGSDVACNTSNAANSVGAVGNGSDVACNTSNAANSVGAVGKSSNDPCNGSDAAAAPKKKVKGGHLRDMINYSDRF